MRWLHYAFALPFVFCTLCVASAQQPPAADTCIIDLTLPDGATVTVDKQAYETQRTFSFRPLTPDTKHLLGEPELRTMRPSALLINTARGGLVDEAALVRALQQGWIAGAGFDVLSVEPPSTGNVLLAPQVLALPNFLLTPHVAWASRPAMQALTDQLTANLEAFARGEPQNRVA